MAILIITHDLGVIAEVADEVIVMYAGKIVESAPVAALFADPQHPYTIGLLGSIPRLDVDRERLSTIEGTVPSPNNQPKGCRFSPRCPFADRQCREEPPPLRDISRRPPGRLLEGAGRAGEERGMSTTAPVPEVPVLEVRGLVKHFPVTRGLIRRRVIGNGARGRGRDLRDRPRRDAGAGRRIGLRQVDDRPAGAAPDGSDGGLGALQGQRDRRPRQAVAAPACAATCRSSSRTPTPRSIRA